MSFIVNNWSSGNSLRVDLASRSLLWGLLAEDPK
jgi:hypothetical protein